MAPKPVPKTKPKPAKASPAKAAASPAKPASAGGFVRPPPTVASGADGTITLKVEEGGAGFSANAVCAVSKINPGQACENAGVKVGMRVVAFQGELLKHGTSWDDLKVLVKAASKPWSFVFAHTVRVETSGSAGFSATE